MTSWDGAEDRAMQRHIDALGHYLNPLYPGGAPLGASSPPPARGKGGRLDLTLLVCVDCGAVMFVPEGTALLVKSQHQRGCLAPLIRNIARTLDDLVERINPPAPEAQP